MKTFFCNSVFFGVLVSIAAYELGTYLKKKWKLAVFNPLLLAVLVVMGLLTLLDMDYTLYYEGAKYISYLLTPATVCLAAPLYEKIELLKRYPGAIFGGILAGVLTSLVSILVFALVFGFTHEQYVTLGGMVTITVAVIIITGVLGNIMAELVLRLFHIEDPIARGIAIGSASHAIGTVKAMEMGEVEGAMSSLSIAVTGLLTVIGASVFAGFL